MSSKIIPRIIPMIFVFVSAAFAAAPGWVAKGVVLDYSVDGDTVTFTVTERTSTEIKIKIDSYKATENTSLNYGQFWFDNSLLEDASKGDKLEEFTVKEEETQTFAGTQWDTVTLEAVISDAKTTRVYDRESGLMLKQTVQADGAPVVTLTKYNVPNFNAVAPPPPSIAEPSQPSTQTTSETPEPQDSETKVTDPVKESAETGEEPEKPCLASVLLLVLAGVLFIKS